MGLNITHTMNSFQFESREHLRNAAKNILNKQGASTETMQKILDKSVFHTNSYENTQQTILSTSAQITLNNSLKETLKYLKSQSHNKSNKKPMLGELWNIVNKEEITYNGELADYVIDSSIENIFAAA